MMSFKNKIATTEALIPSSCSYKVARTITMARCIKFICKQGRMTFDLLVHFPSIDNVHLVCC